MVDAIIRLFPEIHHWLILSAALFSVGLYGLLTRRNAIGILISIELMLNSAALNFVVFARFVAGADPGGPIMSIFIIATAAAESVVAMAIFVEIFRTRHSVDVTEMDQMKY